MQKLVDAINKVMEEVRCIGKNTEVGTGRNSYRGVKDADVKIAFSKAMSSNGLCILPIGIEEDTRVDRWEQEYNGQKQQKQSIFTKVTTKYLLLHSSGEKIELIGYGHGIDPQDKGAGKATTYALKNCLLNTFLTATGDIDDSDNTHGDDIVTPPTEPTVKKPAKKQTNTDKAPITKANFEATLKGTKLQIQNVLDKFQLSDSERKVLEGALKNAK